MGSELSPAPAPVPVQPPAGRPRRRWRRGGWWLLLLVFVAVSVVYVGLTPWALHIGGRFTPLREWDGYGQVQASNGGHYLLFTHLEGGLVTSGGGGASCSFLGGCDTLQGQGKLCGRDGKTYTFTLRGEVKAWWSTDGSRTSVDLTGNLLPDGWVVAFAGRWHGPALALADTDNSFTEVFTPAGGIRQVTSTADAGTATATVRYGTVAAFEQACRRLAGGG